MIYSAVTILPCWQIRQRSPKRASLMSAEQSELDGLRFFDPQVITAIHNRYFPELFRYARYRLGDENLAEDIAGEVFTRLLESVNAGQGPRSSLRGWLMGTASNLINDHLRRLYAHPVETLLEEAEHLKDGGGAHFSMEQADRQRALREAIAKLTPEQQQVIALRFGSGYSLGETAAIMEKNLNAIKALQFRALAALKRTVSDEMP